MPFIGISYNYTKLYPILFGSYEVLLQKFWSFFFWIFTPFVFHFNNKSDISLFTLYYIFNLLKYISCNVTENILHFFFHLQFLELTIYFGYYTAKSKFYFFLNDCILIYMTESYWKVTFFLHKTLFDILLNREIKFRFRFFSLNREIKFCKNFFL